MLAQIGPRRQPKESRNHMPKPLIKEQSFYDYLKHITTLSTGSIVLLATFAEKFPKDAAWRPLLGVAMGGFLASVLAALVCMFFSIRHRSEEEPQKVAEG